MKHFGVRSLCLLFIFSLMMASFTGCKKEEKTAMKPYDFTQHDWKLQTPASSIDVVPFNSADSGTGDASARILQGVVNKKQPRVYIAKDWTKNGVNAENVRQDILKTYGKVSLQELARDTSDNHKGNTTFWTIFHKYADEIETIFVFSDKLDLNDTINVAAMFASRYNGVAVNQELADQIVAAGYNLPVVNIVEYCGFTGDNANTFAINQWISDNMVDDSSRSLVVALDPVERGEGEKFMPAYFDLAVATNAVIYNAAYVYLDQGKTIQKSLLDQFPDNTPVVGWPYLNMEGEYVNSISECGKVVAGSDWGFENGSIWSAFPAYTHEETVSPIPDSYAVKDGDVYVAFMVSDGDAWHFISGDFLIFWQNAVRGKQPIGWTIPSQFSTYSPLMLEYMYDTKSNLDNLMQGPSGVGYLYPSKTPASSFDNFLKSTKTIFSKLGINMVNVWDLNAGSNGMTGDNPDVFKKYADAVKPDAIFRGHDSKTGSYEIYNGTVIIEEVGNFDGRGVMNSEDILKAIDTMSGKTASGKPTFLLLNVEAWGDCVAAIQPAIDAINARADASKYHFVTPAELVSAIKTYESK